MESEDRVAIVTGGSSGIGREIAKQLAQDGLEILVADIRREPRRGERFQTNIERPIAELIRSELGGEASFVQTDTADERDVETAIKTAIDRYGRLDVLVNNAGIHVPGGTADLPAKDWNRVLDVNLTGYFLMAKHAIDNLVTADAGRIVNISSINATFGGAGPAYAASKAGVVNLTRDLAVELAPDGVTANAVLPGMIKTAAQDDVDQAMLKIERERTLLPRIGEPEDVAKAVSFFVSKEAEWITGSSLVIDGGYLAGHQ